MKIKERIRDNKEVMMTGFWAGVGFWTASKFVREAYMAIKKVIEF